VYYFRHVYECHEAVQIDWSAEALIEVHILEEAGGEVIQAKRTQISRWHYKVACYNSEKV
jgi:tRNA U34 5-carboxymethylaminomethyl modifying enzyme MnmG/GidA